MVFRVREEELYIYTIKKITRIFKYILPNVFNSTRSDYFIA